MSRLAQARRILCIAVVATAMYGLGSRLHRDWPGPEILRLSPVAAALSCCCAAAGILLHAALWRSTVRRLGHELALATALRIWFVSQLTRYAPGGVWSYLARPYLAGKAGVPHPVAVLSLAVEALQTLTAALLVTVASIPLGGPPVAGLAALVLLAPLSLVYFRPELLPAVASRCCIRTEITGKIVGPSRRDLLALLPGYCAIWLAHGIGLFFLTRATTPMAFDKIPALTGVFALAWSAGFLCLLAPSGLGVREWALSGLLSTFMPPPSAVIVSVLSRFMLSAAEIACVLAVVALAGDGRRGRESPAPQAQARGGRAVRTEG